MKLLFEEMGGTYHKETGYLIPDTGLLYNFKFEGAESGIL